MERKPRIALLIDADNVSPGQATWAIDQMELKGIVDMKRAYGDWFGVRLKGWEPSLRSRSIRPIQQFGFTKGKNATDMALVIDAVSLLHTDPPDVYAVVSSDADFTPLVIHLRERGLTVHGFGRPDTPQPFREACNTFAPFPQAAASSAAAKGNGRRRTLDADTVDQLRDAVKAAGGKDGWAKVQAVRSRLGPKSTFDHADFGHSTLSKLLRAAGQFEFRDQGPATMVRLKG